MDDCLFCKVIGKQLPAKILFESDKLVAFPDINPSADIHILIVPKQHIGGIGDLKNEHNELLGEIYSVVNKLVEDNGLRDSAYRVVVNGGTAQHVPHVHFHLLGGKWYKFI